MALTTKLGHLTVTSLTVDGVPYRAAPAGLAPANPVAPYPLPLPEKITNAALRDRVEFLTWVLVEAGLIHSVPRAVEGE